MTFQAFCSLGFPCEYLTYRFWYLNVTHYYILNNFRRRRLNILRRLQPIQFLTQIVNNAQVKHDELPLIEINLRLCRCAGFLIKLCRNFKKRTHLFVCRNPQKSEIFIPQTHGNHKSLLIYYFLTLFDSTNLRKTIKHLYVIRSGGAGNCKWILKILS